ncbi:BPTI/Kunitz domain-containing protein-like [Styela clava]
MKSQFKVIVSVCCILLLLYSELSRAAGSTKKRRSIKAKLFDRCSLQKDPGNGPHQLKKFYHKYTWNPLLNKRCFSFTYHGFGGNTNRFSTLDECEKACVPDCLQRKKIMPCYARVPRYYFNKWLKVCLQFEWGGCQANKNNFLTKKACKDKCM